MKPKQLKPLDLVLHEGAHLENSATQLKETARLVQEAAWGTHWEEVMTGRLVDGAVYAVRRVYLFPKRRVSPSIAVARWLALWGWQNIHGVIEPATGQATLEVWAGRPKLQERKR